MLNKKKGGLLFVVSGPSGSGKTTLLERAVKDRLLKGSLIKSISFTTRAPRAREINGKDYIFISRNEFFRMRKRKEFAEWTNYLGSYYASSKKLIKTKLQENKNLIFSIDIKGAFNIKKLFPGKAVLIFIMPPSLDILKKRLRARRSDKAHICAKRLGVAIKEIEAARRYDYIVVNKDLKKSTKELVSIILTANKK